MGRGILALFQRLFGMGKNVAKTDVADVTKTDVGEVAGKFDETTQPGQFKKQGEIIDEEGQTETIIGSYRPESFTETQMRQGVGSFSDEALTRRFYDEGFDDTMSPEEFIIQERRITPEMRTAELRDKGKIKSLTADEIEDSLELTGKEHPLIGQIAMATGKKKIEVKQAIVDRMNEAYQPRDPKRTMIDDDDQIGAYISNNTQPRQVDEFIADLMADIGDAPIGDEVLEAGKIAQAMGKANPEELKEIRGMANESVRMLEEMGLDVSRIDLDLVNNTDDMMLIHQEMLKIKKLTDSLQGGAGALPPDQLRKVIDAVRAEADKDLARALKMAEDALTPSEVEEAQKIILQIRDAFTESVRTGVYNSPFGRTKNSKGGRVKFGSGSVKVVNYLTKLFSKGNMKAADKIADKKQIENVIRDPDTELERTFKDNPITGQKATPKDKMTIDEIRDMIQNDPRYDNLTAQQMDMVVRRETTRADFAYNMGIKPEEVDDGVVDLLMMEGYDKRFGFANGGGVGSLFKRKVA